MKISFQFSKKEDAIGKIQSINGREVLVDKHQKGKICFVDVAVVEKLKPNTLYSMDGVITHGTSVCYFVPYNWKHINDIKPKVPKPKISVNFKPRYFNFEGCEGMFLISLPEKVEPAFIHWCETNNKVLKVRRGHKFIPKEVFEEFWNPKE